ncbi:6,7-dimethyl-8-ribityllumazine synthase [Taylorella equigenitalis]|uniref:6,7-dimethyl-8-ribityllumazine synthase n=1 Tax=Taylorella equigenitalis (strain MCE9) TaxID=937774 RepID=A0A654KJ30_TAYEM|nr:6,7-dimethyl-8-ribityllumazine synthase [Taylorella equigenitalis]ADU91896.1 6,7-dimethyl-8-ribityllumazine synthase [Taylorella equigenitalis MCE9]ASY30114.1 6,7-dimethyl-8-ribityllumazine synthase [Taylorella equigenitalis]KOS58702.1 6,7-dimethyl-8-ribityllumazine synthase [Taylorella equigenitalis]WDU52179.1 6,7-dimethyl-8-ribityllumazine synthase [Taylorella equigenitalis]WDU55181.1 6,7-dimethyl-8-ribityllumazine synthase [Taylorella equigenitalis]
MKPYTMEPDRNGEDLYIGIALSRFNEEIAYAELEACLDELESLGVDESQVMVVTVPGSLELGIALQQMAMSYEFDALIAFGAVVRGDTYHFDVVANESASAISKVSLEMNIPIANGVLTVESADQAHQRAEEKGRDCAVVAVELANLMVALVPEGEDIDEDEDFEYFVDGEDDMDYDDEEEFELDEDEDDFEDEDEDFDDEDDEEDEDDFEDEDDDSDDSDDSDDEEDDDDDDFEDDDDDGDDEEDRRK